MEVSEEMKEEIRRSQTELKHAIRVHQGWVARLRRDCSNSQIERKVKEAETNIVSVSQNQKRVVDRLRRELELYQLRLKQHNKHVNPDNDNRYVAQQLREHQIQHRSKNRAVSLLKPSVLSEIYIKTENNNGDIKPPSNDASDSETKLSNDISEGKENGNYEEALLRDKYDGKYTLIQDSRNNFVNALNKAKESFMGGKLQRDIESWQQGSVPRSSDSEGSLQLEPSPSPSPPPLPDTLDTVTQETFLRTIGLVTLRQKEVLERKRRERRKRCTTSTNRNEFVYDNYDMQPKRKKLNNFPYLQTCTPPQTRSQRLRKQQKQTSENASREGSPSGSSGDNKGGSSGWSSSKPEWISTLPSELIVHPVYPKKTCSACGRSVIPSLLVRCVSCGAHLHTGCSDNGHCTTCTRPPASDSPHHPRTPQPQHKDQLQQLIRDKLKERKRLQEVNVRLCAEVHQLQTHKANLKDSIHHNDSKHRQLLADQINTQRDLQRLLDFVGHFKETSISVRSTSSEASEMSKMDD